MKKLEAVGDIDRPSSMQRIALTSATVAAGGLVGVFMYPDRTAGECRASFCHQALGDASFRHQALEILASCAMRPIVLRRVPWAVTV